MKHEAKFTFAQNEFGFTKAAILAGATVVAGIGILVGVEATTDSPENCIKNRDNITIVDDSTMVLQVSPGIETSPTNPSSNTPTDVPHQTTLPC